jgi:twinkle protein
MSEYKPYSDYGIIIPQNKHTGQVYIRCPQCSHNRKKKNGTCLSVSLDLMVWNCKNCGWKGRLEKMEKIIYKLPEWRNNTNLSVGMVKFFEGRKIDQNTLKLVKITESKEYFGKESYNCINFNYFRGDDLINIKFRTGDKKFKLSKDAELILYNINMITPDTKELYIVEGEMDCLAFIQCGITNVVSVPNGAHISNNKLDYISNSWDSIAHIEKFILALDNDPPGVNLRNDLSKRLGLDRCEYLVFEGAKDANDFLIKNDINSFRREILKTQVFPLEGVFTLENIKDEIDFMYDYGLVKGVSIGVNDFKLDFVKGYITTITGIPSHGKSDFLDNICLRLLIFGKWKGAFYSPENKPTELHVSKMVRKITGKSWDGNERVTKGEVDLAVDILNQNIWFVKPEKDFTIDTLLERIRVLKQRKGIDYFVIDAWNKLEHRRNGQSETDYVGESLDKIALFCEVENLHAFIVVHPTKMKKQKDSTKEEIPGLYDCSGSSHFYNKSDNGITVYRDFELNITQVLVTKVKFSHWGEKCVSVFNYHIPSGRYYQSTDEIAISWLSSPPTQELYTIGETLLNLDDISQEEPPF